MAEQRGHQATSVKPSAESQEVLREQNDPLIGQVIDGRYRVEGRLGEGGMGVVYKASHTTLGKLLAIKVLRPEVSRNEEIVARFKQEAQSASAIGNQHIIDIIDFGALKDGSTYFVMEFLEGQSLTDALAGERFPEARTLRIAKQLCRALGAAHERGIVHRDMKPDNVQLIERGDNADFVKVLDFGIAKVGGSTSKLTQAGQVFGTPHYMSPEQCSGSNVDQRTDIYAVGVILYEMGTGQVPFDADNLMGILTKHLYETPPLPHQLPPPSNVSAGLESVILKCLQKKVDVRYQTMTELLADLEAIENGVTPGAVADQMERHSQTFSRQGTSQQGAGRLTLGVGDAVIPTTSKLPLLLGIAAIVVVLGGAVYAMSGSSKGDAEAADSEATAVAATTAVEAATPAATAEPEVAVPEDSVQPPPAQLQLLTKPAGAEVYRDDALLGTTPFVAFKPAGKDALRLTLKMKGYEDKAVLVRALSPDELSVVLAPVKVQPPPRKGKARKTTTRARKPAATRPKAAPAPKPAPKPSRPSRPQSEVLDPWG